MSDLVECSNCSRLPQPKEEFINSRNRVCKLCRKCRTKAVKHNANPKTKEYLLKYREENKEKISEQCRKAAIAWIQREKERDAVTYNAKIQARRKKCASSKLKQMKVGAGIRNIPWELSDEFALELVTSECVYCGFLDLDKTVNSIDRLDSAKNYTVDNCVACCVHCNMMKGCYDPTTFIERCRKIGECQLKFPGIPKCDLIKTQSRKKVVISSQSRPEEAAQPRALPRTSQTREVQPCPGS